MPEAKLQEHPGIDDTGNLFNKTRVSVIELCTQVEVPITNEQFNNYVRSVRPILAVECPTCRKTVYVVGVSL